MRSWLGLLIPPPKGEGGIGGLRPPFLAPRTPTRSVGSASVARRVGWGFLLIARHSKLGPPTRPRCARPPSPLRGEGLESVAPAQLNLSRMKQAQTVKITVSKLYCNVLMTAS